jgi:hypothetical protein
VPVGISAGRKLFWSQICRHEYAKWNALVFDYQMNDVIVLTSSTFDSKPAPGKVHCLERARGHARMSASPASRMSKIKIESSLNIGATKQGNLAKQPTGCRWGAEADIEAWTYPITVARFTLYMMSPASLEASRTRTPTRHGRYS